MERNSKVIAIVALCIGVVGLSLGFAAFSSTLTIKSSASVKPNADTFNVDFSSTTGSVVSGAVEATRAIINAEGGVVADAVVPEAFIASAASINNTSNPEITGLNVVFTEPGQQATYKFYARNAGELTAYLNSLTFTETTVGEVTGTKVCTAATLTDEEIAAGATQATPALVAQACNGISISVKVGKEANTTASIPTISGHDLAAGNEEEVTVTIKYAADAVRADGKFDVAFGDIVLVYDSLDDVNAG